MSIVVILAPASRRHHTLGVHTPWVQWCLRYAELIRAEAVHLVGVDGSVVARTDLATGVLEGAAPLDRRAWRAAVAPKLQAALGMDRTHASGMVLGVGAAGKALASLLPSMTAPMRDLPAAEQRTWPELEARRLQADLPHADLDAATFRAIGQALRATGAATVDTLPTNAWEGLLSRIHDLATWDVRITSGRREIPRPSGFDGQVRAMVEDVLRSGDVYRPQSHRDVAALKKRLAANVTFVPHLCVDWDAELDQWNVQDVFLSRFRYRDYSVAGACDGWLCVPCKDATELLERIKG